ncbi:hypothetical protein ACQKWADRAFT_325904 [Trichoderma austrokoningii]
MDSLTQWTNLLTSCFEDETLAQRLAADVDEAEDVSLSIQMFCSQQELPENIIRQATILLDIFEVVSKNLPLFFFVLSDPQVRSLFEIAKRFYAIESIVECPAIDPADSTNFKSELFRREPTAVICGLLDRNLIEYDNEKTQQQAIAFLERAISKNFNISRTSISLLAADDVILKQLPDDERKPLLRYLETLQRLHVVVTDAVEINYLMRAGFTSAHDIASTNDYFDSVECEEFSRNAALAVWRRATAIDQRNEHRWADYIRSRTDIPVLALGTGQVSTETADDRVNIASLFGEMNQAQVDEYTSVISPAAYLVDLLEFLRYSLVDPPKDSSGNGKAPTKKNLQDELFERRPDIMNLELSKPNTLNPLRYADLANEVMESYIHSSLNLDDKEAILNKVAPMKDFPFNLAVHTTKDILEAVGISRAIAVELFQNREEMRKIILTSKDSIAYSLVDEAFSRRLASEHLGLDQDDFVAITREAYMSQEFVASTNFLQGVVSREAYGALIGLKSPGEYWGYSQNDTTEDDANKMMIGKVSGIRGIDHIMLGLLPRGGISFQELLLILDTEFIGKTLVISVHDDNGYYTEDYNEMRLKSSPQAEEDGVTFAESCSRLHIFLRLWHRLGWSIADTDAAIMTVEAARLSGSPASVLPIVSSETTEDSGDPAAVEQSNNDADASSNKLIPPKLLPLWGDMRYEGQQSFYHKTFMLPGLLAQYPGLDKKNFESKELNDEDEDTPSDSDAEDKPNGLDAQYTVSTHLIPLQSLLGISHSDTQLLCEMSGVKMSDLWTIASVSTIYRYNLLCKLLGIPLAKLSSWFESDSAARLVFSCPQVTIKVLQRWADMRQNDCTPEWLLSCLQRTVDNFKPTESSADKNFTGFYVPKSTSDVIFTAPESSKVVFDGTELSCGKPTTFPLVQGKCYELTYAGSLGVFSVRVSSSAGDSEPISSNCLISSTTIASFMEVLGTLRRASSVLEKFKLSTNEADTLISTGVNMAQPRWKDLDCIQVFCELRDSTSGDKTTESFYHLLQKLSEGNISDPTLVADTMFHHISTYTSWSIQLMKDCVISKLHEHVSSSQSDFTWTYRCLLSIKQMTAAFDKIGLSTETLTDWIRLQLPKETKAEFVAARTMVALMLKRNDGRVMAACEGLAAKKKAALITFLLSEDKIKAKKIYDANGLFEYFLIDVQMGTEQQTSRVQQAIATIQLYMQRCLLGLEWQWMQKFTLWHANRRPSLRDDKSEAFKAIEAAIADIVRQYIYGAHQVADLEFRGTYHLFARTRTAPYGYYYRALQVTGVRVSDPIYSWHPWSKLEVEIPTAGSYLVPTTYKGRLFLFMPQIMLKTLPKRPSEGSKTCEAYAKDIKVNDLGTQSYWEIKMGWSESLNGVWSTKRVSSASLDISGANKPTTKTPGTDETETDAILKGIKSASQDVNDLPGISSFRFWVRARQPKDYNKEGQMVIDAETDILVIDVFRWVKGSKESEYTLQTLGHFEMRGTHMVAIRETAPATSSTTRLTSPTYFNKLHLSTKDSNWEKLQSNLSNFKEVDSVGETLKPDASQPLLALAPPIKDDRQKLVWTMSYNEYQCSGASGLVVERMTGSRVESYFGAPDRVADGSFNPAIKLAKDSRRMAYDTSQALMEKCSTSGSIDEIFSVLTNVSEGNRSSAFGGRGASKYSELASPYSLYNWELGFHIVMLLVERLLSTQQFELGLQVANMVFDPWLQASQQEGTKAPSTTGASGNSSTTTKGVMTAKQPLKPAQETCWRFAPFKSSKMRTAGSMGKVVKELKAGKGTSNEVAEWLSNPFNAHSLARGRPVIYMRRLVRKYIELLIESGDELFRQSSLESIPLALQRYVQASHLFGSAPQSLPSPTKSTVKTYSQLFKHVNDFSSAAVDLELTFPFFANISGSSAMGIVDQSPKYKGVLGMVRSGYFSVPANPELAALRERIDLRLYQIRNSLDINGNKRRTPLFDPPVDPGQLVRSVALGSMSSSFAGSVDGPMPNYRFLFLLQKAFEMCNELKSLSDAYLTIKEKKDAENLSALRSSQDASTQLLALEIKKMQKEEAEKAIEILQETRESHVMRLKYYLALIGQSESKVPDSKAKWQDFQQAIGTPTKDEFVMSPEEYLEMNKTEEATFLRNIASGIERGCAILMALPNLSTNIQPMGMGASMKFDASNIAQSMQCIASAIQSESTQRSDEASRASRKGQLIRQLQERRLSANMAGRDIKNTDKQIESQRIKSNICDREIEMQNKQIADTSDVIAFMKSKYTNESLYAWMDASMRSLLYQTYVLTMDVAKSAEKAFLFERGPTSARDNLLASSYWDSGRNGAYAAQNLYLGLKRIETAYHKSKSHDYEISKDISLRQLDPWALLQLQETGHVNFSLPELLFDMDFPGHYCRRIKSVSVTIPCVHGPYTSVACMLRLLSHCYRLRQSSGSESTYYPPAQELDADARYSTDRVPISSVAISTANQDNGNFEATFSGERYGPFEGAGAISSWSLDLPKLRQFDYRSISDIILHVKYTSLDGGAGWTEAASTAVTTFQHTFGMIRNFASGAKQATIEIRNVLSQLPFWTRSHTVSIKQSWIINDMPVTPSSKTVGKMKVFETPLGNYGWEDLTITLPVATIEDLRHDSLWALVGYTMS